MKLRYLGIFLLLPLLARGADTVIFSGLRLNYSGPGYVVATPFSNNGAWNVWDLTVVDNLESAAKATLSMRPAEKNPTNFCVRIRSLSAPALKSLSVVFPPGGNGVSYLQNISIASSLGSLSVTGGDLGSNEAGDGLISVKGALNQLKLSGQKFKNKLTGEISYYGGNLWADVSVGGALSVFRAQGGNLGFKPEIFRQRHLSIDGGQFIKSFLLQSVALKDPSGNTRIYGGFASADLSAEQYIENITVRGGGWHNGQIRSWRLGKVAFTGAPLGKTPRPAIEYGLYNTHIASLNTAAPLYFTNYFIGQCTFRGANLQNSVISSHGNLKGLSATEKNGEGGIIFQSQILSGCGYDTAFQSPPVIFAACPTNYVFSAGTNVVLNIPFSITNLPLDSISAIYISQRDLAWGCILSNESGQVFSNFDLWETQGTNAVNGCFVWNPQLGNFDFSGHESILLTNVKIRAAYGIAPEHFVDLPLSLSVRPVALDNPPSNFVVSVSAKSPVRDIYPGNLVKISCVKAMHSTFSAGLKLSSDQKPEHATYLGSLLSFRAKSNALGNFLHSKKNISLDKNFNYDNNEVWVGGSRRLGPGK